MSYQKHIMIDTEALSFRPNGCLLSIGAVMFTMEDGEIDSFYQNIDPVSCKSLGFKVNKDTVNWWSEQKEAMKLLGTDRVGVEEGLGKFVDWIGPKSKKIQYWCHGASYDFPLLTSYFDALDMKEPWLYTNLNDNRTIMNQAGIVLKEQDRGNSVYHNALDDSRFQVKWLRHVLAGVPI